MARKTQHDTMPGRFGLLLIVLICTYLLSAFTTGRWIGAVRIMLFTAIALLALQLGNSLVSRRTAGWILAAVLAGSAIMLAVSFTTETGAGIASIWAGLIPLFAVVLAAAGDQLVDPGGGQRRPVTGAQPQLLAVRLAGPGRGPAGSDRGCGPPGGRS